MSDHLKGLLYAFIGVLILSPDSLLIRLAGIDQWALLGYRGLMMALGMIMVSRLLDQTSLRRQFKNIGRTGVWVALCFTASTIAFVNAVVYTTIANTLLIVATSPLFAMLFGRLFLDDRFKIITLVAIAFVMLGLGLVVGDNPQGSYWLGNACALISAASIAATFVLNRHKKATNMVPAVALSGLLTAIIALPFARWQALDTHTILILALMGVVVTAAFILITIAPRYIPAAEVSLILPLETVGGIGLAWLFLNEAPGQRTLTGAVIILLALTIHAGLGLRQAKSIDT